MTVMKTRCGIFKDAVRTETMILNRRQKLKNIGGLSSTPQSSEVR